jgi:putative DNA primase/helicase
MAGELAIEYGIVPWPKGDAIKAAAEMFDAWRAGRGTVANDEPRQILRRVSDFIDRHGDSRFSDKDACEPLKFGVKDRAGWWTRNDEGKLLYLFTAGGLREALTGHDFEGALKVLASVGALPPPNANGEYAKTVRIPGVKPSRLYEINPEKLEHARI